MLRTSLLPNVPTGQNRWLRVKYWRMSFNNKRKDACSLVDQLHQKEEEFRLYIATGWVEVCEEAWWKIHGIPRSMYMVYKQCLKVGHVHGEVTPLSSWTPRAAKTNLLLVICITKMSQNFIKCFSWVDIHGTCYIVENHNQTWGFVFLIKHTVSN
jgi:hypothetical protein